MIPDRHRWRHVTPERPCPVCGKGSWCSVSADGALAACRRAEAGCWRSRTDKNGSPVYLHRLDGPARPDPVLPPPPGGRSLDRASADMLHRGYSGLLAALRLSQAHREALRGRGLTDVEIDRRGYRSLPRQGRACLARGLREQLGDALLSVPGFVLKPGEDGRPYVTLAGAAGLLIPVRDPAGRVVALLVRPDDTGDGRGKYLYLSSAKHGGPGPGALVHVPLGTAAPAETVRLTEGVLKADVAQALSGLPTVGAAGLVWRPALDALWEMGCRTVRLAFDADAWDKPAVARALAAAAEGLAAAGLAVELEHWELVDGKGIDDLLTAGKTPAVLSGETALAAVREALASATAGELPPEPDGLERLPEVLAAGGAAALFADKPLLEALARLTFTDPAAFAARRATLKGMGVSLRSLDATLKPLVREQARQQPPTLLAEAGYRVEGGRICREHGSPNGGTALVPLCNFTARIVEAVTRDDGAEQSARFTVEGQLADGRPLPPVAVAAAGFARLEWITPAWHGEAVVYAGQGTRDHLRAAIELLSHDRTLRTEYAHTGWREIGGAWYYLHAGGAIGEDGAAVGVEVNLPEALAGFRLPDPPEGADLAVSIRASLALLGGLVPDRIAFPLLAAVCRAALGEAPGPLDLSLFLAGPHGAGKSELAALAQQHCGPALDARHLPGSWLSTGNALESLAFHAKDALLVVDDYAPRGASSDRQRLEREADRLLRAQGNRAGRGRCRTDGTARPQKPPRGLILSTGEDVPPGQSLRGRMLVLEVSPGDVQLPALTPHQRAAEAGLFAQALAGFLRWLAPRYGELRRQLPGERAALRERALAETPTGSPRTPGIVADLALGLNLFLDCARDAEAVTGAEREDLARRGWRALLESAARQAGHVQAAEPAGHFLRLLAAALASGRAHVAGPDGREPEAPAAWGWRREDAPACPAWRAQGRRVGWLDGAALYLEPEASYAAAQELARDQGEGLSVSQGTLAKRLKDKGLLASTDRAREVLTVRRTLEGKRRAVLHLAADTLFPPSPPPDQPDQFPEAPEFSTGVAGRVAPWHPDQHPENGRVVGRVTPGPSAHPASRNGPKPEGNGHLVGLVGFAAGGGTDSQDDSELL